jgi:ATP-dependent Clp protease ATP-binding subunit ClpB
VVIFHPLGEEQLQHIVDLRLKDLDKLLADRHITIELTDRPRGTRSSRPDTIRAYGARPLKRAIQRMVQDPLAMKILDGEVLHGDHVRIDAHKKGSSTLQFEVVSRAGIPLEHGVAIGQA